MSPHSTDPHLPPPLLHFYRSRHFDPKEGDVSPKRGRHAGGFFAWNNDEAFVGGGLEASIMAAAARWDRHWSPAVAGPPRVHCGLIGRGRALGLHCRRDRASHSFEGKRGSPSSSTCASAPWALCPTSHRWEGGGPVVDRAFDWCCRAHDSGGGLGSSGGGGMPKGRGPILIDPPSLGIPSWVDRSDSPRLGGCVIGQDG